MIDTRRYARIGLRSAWSLATAMVLTMIGGFAAQAQGDPASMQILGFVERATIHGDPLLTVKARLDTGARTSSLHAVNMRRFKRDGENWIAFDVVAAKNGHPAVRYERRIKRNVRIVEHGGGYQRRPVVEMAICVGDILREREVSLVDRSALNYPMLIGRNFLSDRILVDSASSLTVTPNCATQDAEVPNADDAETAGAASRSSAESGADDDDGE